MVRPGPLFFSLLFGDGNRVRDAQRRISRKVCTGSGALGNSRGGRKPLDVAIQRSLVTFCRVDLSGGEGTMAQSQDE